MRRWIETRMVRLTEWIRELIPKMRWCISKSAICDFQGDGWRAGKVDNRWGPDTVRALTRTYSVAARTECTTQTCWNWMIPVLYRISSVLPTRRLVMETRLYLGRLPANLFLVVIWRKTLISNRGRWSPLSLFRQVHLGVGKSKNNLPSQGYELLQPGKQ